MTANEFAAITPGKLAALNGVPHALPYQGSKRALAHSIIPLIPAGTERLVEPFAGSAAISIAALYSGKVQHVAMRDLNGPLMRLWVAIIENPAQLADEYTRIWEESLPDPRAQYSKIRDEFNQTGDPAKFLYLLARCVKAAVRYNARGEFNQGADNRRLGAKPAAMRRRLVDTAKVLAGRSTVESGDFREALHATDENAVTYMDPPYQGTSKGRDSRYLSGLSYEDFVVEIKAATLAGKSFMISYDGATGERTYGRNLPEDLNLLHLHLAAGVSSQATLMGDKGMTIESLYLSPALVDRLGGATAIRDLLTTEQAPPGQLLDGLDWDGGSE